MLEAGSEAGEEKAGSIATVFLEDVPLGPKRGLTLTIHGEMTRAGVHIPAGGCLYLPMCLRTHFSRRI